MPSAKLLEKQASAQAENIENNANTPIRQALVIIEHKIRNLEKRKTKLESYRAIQASGKELSGDQKTAVAKYDEVAQSLEFARELSKQMLQLANSSEKEQRKQARKDALLRTQTETLKIREVLTIQNVLWHLSDQTFRDDFLNGSNGAVKLEENEISILEKFYCDIHVKRQCQPEDVPFMTVTQKAAELLSMTIDGRPKQYGDTTFENVRKILQSIQDCGYLDKAGKLEVEEISVEQDDDVHSESPEAETIPSETEQTPIMENVADSSDESSANGSTQPTPVTEHPAGQHGDVPQFQPEAPSAAAVPAPAFPQPPPQQQPTIVNTQIPSQPQVQRPIIQPTVVSVSQGQVPQVQAVVASSNPVNALHAGHFPPTTVRAVEQAYFKQHQYIQQMRPLAEVIGSANFFFLQESELDSPDMIPSGFAGSDQQASAPNLPAGNLPQQQSPGSTSVLTSQPNVQPQIPMQQPGIQTKVQQTAPAPIPTQTFTNQSFPNIVPPQAIFPPQTVQNPEIPSSQPQIPVFTAQPIPIPQMVAQGAVVSQGSGVALPIVESTQSPVITHPNQQINTTNMITGPSGANVPLPGFSNTKYSPATPPIGIQQLPPNQHSSVEKYEQIQPSPQIIHNDKPIPHLVEDNKDTRNNDANSEWESNDPNQQTPAPTIIHHEEESNQWSSEVSNNTKSSNEWNSGYDNQNESNTWNNNQNDNYSSRNNNRSSFGGSTRQSGGGGGTGGGGGGNRGLRGNSGPSSNGGYRGRSNNSYQSQNGRNSGMYFRNNGENYYQNQNGAGNSGGGGGNGGGGGYNSGKQDTGGGNYTGSSNNTFRSRGGQVPPSNRQATGGRTGPPNSGSSGAPPRNNTNPNRTSIGVSNSANRPGGRTSGGGNSANSYGNSRPPPNNIRQHQQDVNA